METFEERYSFSEVINAMWKIFIHVADRQTHWKEIRQYIELKERATQLLARTITRREQ